MQIPRKQIYCQTVVWRQNKMLAILFSSSHSNLMEASKLQINYKELFYKISSFPEETARQLLEYVDFLWEKHTPADDLLSDLDKSELDRRVKRYIQNPETGLSLEQVISGLEIDLGEKLG